MDLKYFTNIGDDSYELILHGVVGEEINGAGIASEIHFLNQIGAKTIVERINTIGGTVVDAYSIVSANISSNATIHTINEGVSDSSGSFILASGNKRSAYDFSTMLVHNPSYKGVSLDDMADSDLKNDLIMMRDSIVTILSNNSKKSKEEVIELMSKSTRMTAEDAKAFGFIDEIITSSNRPNITKDMSLLEIMNICSEQVNNNNNNNMDLKDLENKVENLNGQITVKDEAISAFENKILEKDIQIEEFENKAGETKTEIDALKAKISDFENKEIEVAVNAAKSKFADNSEEDLTKQCKALGVENFNKFVASIKLTQANAAGEINNGGKPKDKESDLAKEYQNLAESDPTELGRLKIEEPENFNKMFNAWNKA